MAETEGKALVRRLEDIMLRRALDELNDILTPDFVRICEARPTSS